MKNLIIKILLETQSSKKLDRISTAYESISNTIKKKFGNVVVTPEISNNGDKGQIIIDVINNDLNLKKISEGINEIIHTLSGIHKVIGEDNNYYSYFRWKFGNQTQKKFKESDYVKHFESKFRENNIDPVEHMNNFDGESISYLHKQMVEFDKMKTIEIQQEIKNFLQEKTDVPLKLKFRNTSKTFFVEIYPQFDMNDFLSCKYMRWNFPKKTYYLDSLIMDKLRYKSGEYRGWTLDVDIIWPREVGSYILNQNKILRDSLPNDIPSTLGVRIDFGPCIKNPEITIGSDYGTLIDKKVDGSRIRSVAKSLGFDNVKIDYQDGQYWLAKNAWNSEDKRYWSKEEIFNFFVNNSKKKHGKIYEYSIDRFFDLDTPAEVFCKKHGTWFKVDPKQHIKGKKCPFDNESSGENLVRVYLEGKNINFKQYYRFDKCVSEVNNKCYKLPFDFYLPDYNILIEYDGEQHYKPIKIWGGQEGFERQQKLDLIKNKFAVDNDINLIRIPYKVKKIEDLKKYLPDNLFIN